MRRYLILVAALMLPSCGMFGGGENVAIPVAEVAAVGELALQAANFDYDYNGKLENEEVTAFVAWFGLQIWSKWAVPTTQETAAERARAAGEPLPK